MDQDFSTLRHTIENKFHLDPQSKSTDVPKWITVYKENQEFRDIVDEISSYSNKGLDSLDSKSSTCNKGWIRLLGLCMDIKRCNFHFSLKILQYMW